MKKIHKILLTVIAVMILAVATLFSWLTFATYSPSNVATNVLSQVATEYTITDEEMFIRFSPQQPNPYQLVLYNGALVDSTAYAPLAQQLAKVGYTVYLVKTPFNLPIVASQRALEIVDQEQLTHVIIGGHSLGGVVASNNALALDDKLAGIVLLASYPANHSDLSSLTVPVLSITGTNDEVIKWSSYENSQSRLPKDTHYISIVGGNHAGFGDYGAQKNDGIASISSTDQQAQVVNAIQQIFR